MSPDPHNKSSQKNPVGTFMVAAGAVLELDTTGKILLIQRNKDLDWHPKEWEICYGRIDQFEDVESGLRREVSEELGVGDMKILQVLRVWHMFRGSQKAENELIGITYHCRTTIQKIQLSPEHSHYQWVAPEQALEMIVNEGIKEDVKRSQKYLKSPIKVL